MDLPLSELVTILVATALITAGLGIYALRLRANPGATPFSVTMGLAALWVINDVNPVRSSHSAFPPGTAGYAPGRHTLSRPGEPGQSRRYASFSSF